jgi:LPS O-antigen subunit length determinant protein (WzzB/FepE family)
MKTFIIAVVFLVIGAVVGGFVALSFNTHDNRPGFAQI